MYIISDQINLVYEATYVKMHYKYSFMSNKLIGVNIFPFWKYLTIVILFAPGSLHYTKISVIIYLIPKHIYNMSGLLNHICLMIAHYRRQMDSSSRVHFSANMLFQYQLRTTSLIPLLPFSSIRSFSVTLFFQLLLLLFRHI